MWGQRLETCGAGAVADDHTGSDRRRRGRDLPVRHTQQHGVAVRSISTAAQGAFELEPRMRAQRAGDGSSEAACADNRQSRAARE